MMLCSHHMRAAQRRVSLCRLRRAFATAAPNSAPKGFSLIETKAVPELQLHASLFRHDRTGLEHMHVAKADDENNVFSIGFATPAVDSTGLPHILEHTTLCGSAKYPVRDPFFKMLNRSLATYMNAFTAIDHTFYPFSTVNATDFRNLRDVYLDATLHPQLKKLDFLQEGWRLEHTDTANLGSPLELKGVVYNEMKGQMSDANYYFYIAYAREMYRGTIYGNDSGGDPAVIPDLTYENLVAYHKTHYHPSNAKVFTYGSFDPMETMQTLDRALEPFQSQRNRAQDTLLRTTLQRSTGRTVEATGPFDQMVDPGQQVKYSLSFVCGSIGEGFENFAMRLLSTLLLDGHGAPLYQALVESRLGTDYSANTGYDTSAPVGIFTVGIQGLTDQAIASARSAIYQTLSKVAAEGFPQAKVDGVVHQMEIALKRRSANFGMNLLNSIAGPWFKGVGMSDLLVWNEHVQRLRAEMSSGPYLQNLVQKYLIRESRSADLEFVMRPDGDHEAQLARREATRLQAAAASLTPDDHAALAESANKLLTAQASEEDLSSLPSLSVDDIARDTTEPLLQRDALKRGAEISWNERATGLTYVRMLTELQDVPADLIPLLPLYADCLTNLGTTKYPVSELEDKIRLTTGGISCSTFVSTNPDDVHQHRYGLVLAGHSLDRNIGAMFELFAEICLSTKFDNADKLQTLIRQSTTGITSSVAESGHIFARAVANAALTAGGKLSDQLNGMAQVRALARLARETTVGTTIAELERLHAIVLGSARRRYLITTGADSITTARHGVDVLQQRLQEYVIDATPSGTTLSLAKQSQLFTTPYAVDFMAHGVLGHAYNDPRGAVLQVLSKIMTNKYLHREIRERGGAYGGGASYAPLSGILSFYSYRDPDGLKSLETVRRVPDWFRRNAISQRELDEAKLSIFQSVDAPRSVASQGVGEFVDGVTPLMRQHRREALLDVSIGQVSAAVEVWLEEAERMGNTSSAILRQQSKMADTPRGLWRLDEWLMGQDNAALPECPQDSPSEVSPAMKKGVPAGVDDFGQGISRRLTRPDGEAGCMTIELTNRAVAKLAAIILKKGKDQMALRVALESGGCHGYQYVLSLTNDIDEEEDVILTKDGARVVVDQVSLELIDGSKLDYTSELIGTEFKVIDNPRATSSCGCDVSVSIEVGPKPVRSAKP